MSWLARELSATDLGAAPPGKMWNWDTMRQSWRLIPSTTDQTAPPAASRPVRQTNLGPFDMPVRRNPTLSASRPAVVAAGEAVRRMR